MRWREALSKNRGILPAKRNQAWDDLSRVRALGDEWGAIEAEETRLLAQMTIQDSLRHLLALHRAFEPHLQQTEVIFRAERLAHLAELQHRLAQLDKIEE